MIQVLNNLKSYDAATLIRAIKIARKAFGDAEDLPIRGAGPMNRFTVDLPLPDDLYGPGGSVRFTRHGTLILTIRTRAGKQNPIVRVSEEDPEYTFPERTRPSADYIDTILERWLKIANTHSDTASEQRWVETDRALANIARGALAARYGTWRDGRIWPPTHVNRDGPPACAGGAISGRTSLHFHHYMQAPTSWGCGMSSALIETITAHSSDRVILNGFNTGGTRSPNRWDFELKRPDVLVIDQSDDPIQSLRAIAALPEECALLDRLPVVPKKRRKSAASQQDQIRE